MGLAEAVKFRSFNRVGKRALCLGSDLRQPSSAKHFHKMLAGLTHGVSPRSWLGRATLRPAALATTVRGARRFPRSGIRAPHRQHGREQVYPGGGFGYHLQPFRAAVEAGTAA